MDESSADADGLRVLYSFPHPLGGPGIGTTAWHQVSGLVDRGADVTVLCTSLAKPMQGSAEVVETMVVGGRRVPHRVLGTERAYRYHDLRVARRLRRSPGRFDVVHTWPAGAVRTLRAARDTGVVGLRESPNTYTAMAFRLAAEEAERLGVELPRGASHRFDQRRLDREEHEFGAARAVLVPSEFVERSFAERPGPPVVTRRHRYGFDPARFPVPDLHRPDRPFTVAFVGSGEPRKGLHHALEAWNRSGVVQGGGRFIVCGRIVPDYFRVVAPLLDHPSIEVRPFTDDVGAVMRDADVLVLPSVEEGSALVTYEAQASGCALLVSDASGAMMTDGQDGFVHTAGDVEALTTHLQLLAEDRRLLAAMRSSVIARREELSWSSAAVKLESIYRELLLDGQSG